MDLRDTPLAGVKLIEQACQNDERGYFGRLFCQRSLAERGVVFTPAQISVSFNRSRGTLRGMHYQRAPRQERKIVMCLAGAIHDVALDLRPDSPTYRQWHAVTLRAGSGLALLIPEGCAHGFQTLAEGALVGYIISAEYEVTAARGVRWDDPAFAIDWPLPVSVISHRDRSFPDYQEGA